MQVHDSRKHTNWNHMLKHSQRVVRCLLNCCVQKYVWYLLGSKMHVFPYTQTTNLWICGCMYNLYCYHSIFSYFFFYLQSNTLVTCKVTRWFKEMLYFLINMTTKLGRDIRNFITRKVSCTIHVCQHLLVYKSLNLIWKFHMLTDRVVLDIDFIITWLWLLSWQ